jgi:hypothetical protein
MGGTLGPRSSSMRGSLALAVQVASDPSLRAKAAAEFESRMLASTTTYDAQLKTIVKIAEAAKFPLLPVTRERVAVIGCKAANFKSTNLVRYKRAHVEAGYPSSDELLLVLRSAKRAATRGIGSTKEAAVFNVEMVAGVLDVAAPVSDGGPRHPRRFVIIGASWLLRGIEASLVRISQLSIAADGVTADLDFPVSTTDPDGRGFVRSHSCPEAGCRSACGAPTCPACTIAVQVLARRAEGAGPEDPLFACREGAVVQKRAAVATISAIVEESGQPCDEQEPKC